MVFLGQSVLSRSSNTYIHSWFQSICAALKAHVTPCVKRSVGGRQVCTLPPLALDEKKNSLPSLLSRQGVHKKNRTEVSAVAIFAFKWCARGVLLLNVVHHFVEETTWGLVAGRVKLRPDAENLSLTITRESKRTTEQGGIKCKLL